MSDQSNPTTVPESIPATNDTAPLVEPKVTETSTTETKPDPVAAKPDLPFTLNVNINNPTPTVSETPKEPEVVTPVVPVKSEEPQQATIPEHVKESTPTLAKETLLKLANVPEELQPLIPDDLVKAAEYLASDSYLALKSKLTVPIQVQPLGSAPPNGSSQKPPPATFDAITRTDLDQFNKCFGS